MPTTTETICPECEQAFLPSRSDQRFCSTRCGARYRYDQSYFGGRRKSARGLAEGTCQVCHSQPRKGLSVHHVTGEKDGDLVALCKGCHRLVTELARRRFIAEPDAWQRLIGFALQRKGLPARVHVKL